MDQATLDDPAAIAAVDESDMLGAVGGLGRQLGQGFHAGLAVPGLPSAASLRSVVVCGMGGSGIAGDVARSLLAERLAIPIGVIKGYTLPEYCQRNTLVIALSFSGNTEETLAAYAQAVAAGCRVVAVSAGGELAALADADGTAWVAVPASIPAPRAALGFLSGAALGLLQAVGLAPPCDADVDRTAALLDQMAGGFSSTVGEEENEAKSVARWLLGRVPVVWGSEGLAGAAALRWKNQLNENAKVPAFRSVLPELDHNEIEGWSAQAGESFAVVALRHRGEHPRVEARLSATLQAVAGSGLAARQVEAEGSSALEWLFSLILKGDFVSTYLAILRGVDPTPVPVLTGLKERLPR